MSRVSNPSFERLTVRYAPSGAPLLRFCDVEIELRHEEARMLGEALLRMVARMDRKETP